MGRTAMSKNGKNSKFDKKQARWERLVEIYASMRRSRRIHCHSLASQIDAPASKRFLKSLGLTEFPDLNYDFNEQQN